MADDEDDLRINTLHRFAKRSPRLMLQEYSHCEVPAGCGGVVLRWLDPAEGVPAVIRVACLGRSGASLDGAEERYGHVNVRAGRHVVAVHHHEVGNRWWDKLAPSSLPSPLSVGVVSDATDDERDLLRTASDLRWRWTDVSPTDGWRDVDFDDGGWRELTEDGAALLESIPEQGRYGFDDALGRGQPFFAIRALEVWVRVTFTLAARAPAAPGGPAL